jgi:sodium-dependent dicarboxylate transporter 2/3/5
MQQTIQSWARIAGPLLAAVVGLWAWSVDLPATACWTAGITTLCAVWWMTEAIPLPATSLIPFAALPLCGVIDHRTVASAYGHTLILLMLGGSFISLAMQQSGAHRRVALGLVRAVGGGGGRPLVLGFMIASAGLSMWISNTATALMLMPVAIAVVQSSTRNELGAPLMLAVAYGASIGGCGSPIGSPPNLICLEALRQTGQTISFLGWMKLGAPVVVVMLPLMWLWLVRNLRGTERLSLPELGKWRSAERRVLTIFGLTAVAWMTRSAPWGGWSGALGVSQTAGDASVALAAAALLFILPSGRPDGSRLLDWEATRNTPWGMFLMIGGGIAIGQAFVSSGLNTAVGEVLAPLGSLPLLLMLAGICLLATFMTEVSSNTAVANIMMPILASTAAAAEIDPLLLMFPAALSLNCAFMLPVATPPNAIAHGTGDVPIATMIREGFVLNLMGVVVIAGMAYAMLGG